MSIEGENGPYTIFNPPKINHKFGTARRVVRNTQNISDSYLFVNFALLNLYHISLQFEPDNLLWRGLQVICVQLYFCGFIFKVMASRLNG